MAISIRVNNEDEEIIKKYAEIKQMTVSEIMRQAIMRQIEDEFDLEAYEKAMEEYRKNPVTYSHDEVKRMLAID